MEYQIKLLKLLRKLSEQVDSQLSSEIAIDNNANTFEQIHWQQLLHVFTDRETGITDMWLIFVILTDCAVWDLLKKASCWKRDLQLRTE